jgi:hypothetical protein
MKLHIERRGAMSPTIKADIDTVKLSEADRKKNEVEEAVLPPRIRLYFLFP